MNPNELRIGNFIDTDERVTLLVTGITSDQIGLKRPDGKEGSLHPIFLQGTLLTEEWLLKFGFEQEMDYDICNSISKVPHFYNEEFRIIQSKGFWYSSLRYDGGTSECYEGEIEIKYVHQLQNLYFAITGNELTIKDNV
jgi:hypothetical protein